MTKIKERAKNIGFWISIASSVMLILGAFGVEIGDDTVSAVINGVASFLVVCGIVSDPTTGTGYLDGLSTVLDSAEKGDISVAAAIKSVLADMDAAETDGNGKTPESAAVNKESQSENKTE